MRFITLFFVIIMIINQLEGQVPAQRSQKYVEKAIVGKWVLDKEKLARVTLSDYEKQGKTVDADLRKQVKDNVESSNAFMEFKADKKLVQKIQENPEETLEWSYDEKKERLIIVLANGKKDALRIVKLTKFLFVFDTSDGEVYFRKEK